MQRRRILFLNAVGVIGGQEMVLLDLVRGLDPARFESVVASVLPGALTDVLRAEGRAAHVLPPHRLRKPHTLARTLVALARLLREERIDIVHCNGDALLFYGAVAGALRRVPCVWHVYEPVVTRGHAYARFFYETQRHLRADWTIFGTAAVEESYLSCYPRLGPHSAIMPGVDIDAVTRDADGERARRRFGLPPDAPLLLVIGRLTRWKGQREAIEALAALPAFTPAPHLVLCGGPPYLTDEDYPDELVRVTRSLGLEERVHFVGAATEAEKRDLLLAATALVHPAQREAFGIVVIEGMAAGKPVVVTDAVGPRSIVEGSGAGELVPRGDVRALADAVARVLSDPERARSMGAVGQAHVRAHYDKVQMVRRVEDVYERVLGHRRGVAA
jgi:glycosyltransferase involved in cell wall biosynthesis